MEWNARDENKYYVFDYYRDNCATRIRDLIDRATAGALARASTGGAEMTWRQHTERLSAEDLPVFLGLYVAMGPVIDRPITEWEEMFLPAKLADGVARAGLVEEQRLVIGAHRAAARAGPPAGRPAGSPWGAIGALALAALGWFAGRGARAARVGLGIGLASFGALVGSLGCLFVFLWLFTNHGSRTATRNILACAPLGGAPRRRRPRGGPRSARRVTRAARLSAKQGSRFPSATSAPPQVLRGFQDNALVLAFVVPVWSGAVAWSTWPPARALLCGPQAVRIERPQELAVRLPPRLPAARARALRPAPHDRARRLAPLPGDRGRDAPRALREAGAVGRQDHPGECAYRGGRFPRSSHKSACRGADPRR